MGGGSGAAIGGRNPAGGAYVNAFTLDKGTTWSMAATPLAGPAGGQGIVELGMVWLPSAGVFFACGGSFLNNSGTSPTGDVWATTDIAGFYSTTGIFMIGSTACVVRGNNNQASLTSNGTAANVRALPGLSYTCGVSDGASIAYIANAAGAQPGARSVDGGLTWAAGASFAAASSTLCRGAYGNGVMVYPLAGAQTRVMYSTDKGASWNQSNVFPGGAMIATSLVFAQGVFLLVGSQATPAGQRVLRSTNGLDWVELTRLLPSVGGIQWAIAHNGAGAYVGVLGSSGGENDTAVGVC